LVEAQFNEARHIFSQNVAGSQLCNEACHLRPEVAVICLAASLPGDGEGLAGESSNKDSWLCGLPVGLLDKGVIV
jgi:hypothetical protein